MQTSNPDIKQSCCCYLTEESTDSELCVVMPISTTWGSNGFKVKSIVKTLILLIDMLHEDC